LLLHSLYRTKAILFCNIVPRENSLCTSEGIRRPFAALSADALARAFLEPRRPAGVQELRFSEHETMTIAAKVSALLTQLRRQDLEALSPFERQRFADLCHFVGNLAARQSHPLLPAGLADREVRRGTG
jgi:hypothetical protein